MKRFFVFAALSISLSACASTGQQARAPIPSVKCKIGADCDAKWSRAVAWVSQNSGYKIQTQTDTLIQTYGPSDSSPSIAAVVNKVSVSGDTYEIAGRLNCANLFGCVPDSHDALIDFSKFVSGS